MDTSQQQQIQQIKKAMRATWMAGDFGVIAKIMEGRAEDFAQRLVIPAGARVLDVACGTGNLAIPIARGGAIVTGVDIAPNLLVQARERATAEGLTVSFDEGDAEELPYPAGSFDVVVTMFGAMFTPRPEVAASELARVLKPGGLLGMANWNPESFSSRMFQLSGRHVPPPPGVPPPALWGHAATVSERLKPFFQDIRSELVPIDFDLPTNAAGAVALFREYFGPTRVAFSRLDEAGQAAFASELESLWANANAAIDNDRHTLVRNEYLAVTGIRQ